MASPFEIYPVMRKRLKIAVFIAGFLCIALMVFRYFGFVSKTVYEESVSLSVPSAYYQTDEKLPSDEKHFPHK